MQRLCPLLGFLFFPSLHLHLALMNLCLRGWIIIINIIIVVIIIIIINNNE